MSYRINPAGGGQAPPVRSPATGPSASGSFEQALERAQARKPGLRISAHAAERMRAHGIHNDGKMQARLSSAIDLARAKGIRSSLVVMPDSNWIVSVPNSTVVTVVPRDGAASARVDGVFSQIDGAVVMP